MTPSAAPTVLSNIIQEGETISAPQRTCPVTETWPCFAFYFSRNFKSFIYVRAGVCVNVYVHVYINVCIYVYTLVSTKASKAGSSQNLFLL